MAFYEVWPTASARRRVNYVQIAEAGKQREPGGVGPAHVVSVSRESAPF